MAKLSNTRVSFLGGVLAENANIYIYLMCCGVMLLLLIMYIYIYIYIYVCVYISAFMKVGMINMKKY